MKRSNAHQVTLRAVLGMLFMYLCPHLVKRQMLKTPRASRASVCMCAQGSRVRPIWSHMRPNFSRVRLKKNFSRTGASSHSRKQNKSLRDSESLSAVRQQTR